MTSHEVVLLRGARPRKRDNEQDSKHQVRAHGRRFERENALLVDMPDGFSKLGLALQRVPLDPSGQPRSRCAPTGSTPFAPRNNLLTVYLHRTKPRRSAASVRAREAGWWPRRARRVSARQPPSHCRAALEVDVGAGSRNGLH